MVQLLIRKNSPEMAECARQWASRYHAALVAAVEPRGWKVVEVRAEWSPHETMTLERAMALEKMGCPLDLLNGDWMLAARVKRLKSDKTVLFPIPCGDLGVGTAQVAATATAQQLEGAEDEPVVFA